MVDYSKWDNLDVSSDDDHDPYSGGGSDPSDDDDWCSHWVSEVRATYGSSLQVGTWRTMPTAPRTLCDQRARRGAAPAGDTARASLPAGQA